MLAFYGFLRPDPVTSQSTARFRCANIFKHSSKEQPEPSVPTKSIRQDEKDSLFGKSANNVEEKKIDTKTFIHKIENKDPALQKKKTQEIAASEPGDTANEDLFAASPPTDKHQKTKGKNVLSLFDDDEDDNFEDQPQINNNKNESRKPPSEKSSHGKSTGVFQDEELLFSDELQKDNDPDVDLFASTKKPLTEKSKQAKPSPGVGLFGDDDEDDLFSASKPQKPPKVHEKKTVIRKESSDTSKDIVKVPDAVPDPLKESVVVAPKDAGHPAGPAPIKAKSASSRIGKLQANLHINPAAMLPGAVPKLPGARPTAPWQGLPTPAPTDGCDSARMPDAKNSASEAVSFEKPAQIDTLHNANKTRAKVAGKRRPPTRMGRKSVSQDEDPVDPLFGSSHSAEAGPPQFNQGLERTEHISTMKLSLSENDVQSKTNPKIIGKSLTPDVNDLFGSDLFAKSVFPKKTTVSRSTEVSPDGAVTSKSVQEIVKKSPAVTLDEEASDDDLFHAVKQKSNKAPTSTAHLPEAEDDLFGDPKPQKKDSKPTSSDIFEQDIFSTEAIKPVKKAKEKKPAQEASLFDDNLDIFADLTHKPKEKKTKKKVESKSIFDDDMDDIFSSGNPKKPKPKAKSSHPSTEKKSDQKAASTFDDPLNVLGK
ncbi:WASH complex subunit 2C-like [Discoglossus pictus]